MNRAHSNHKIHLKEPVVLAIDVGSSSIRCRAYRLIYKREGVDHHGETQGAKLKSGVSVKEVEDCHCQCSTSLKPIETKTGKILWKQKGKDENGQEDREEANLFDEIDSCVDAVLKKLRSCSKDEKVDAPAEGDDQTQNLHSWFNVVGVAISSFTMNLIGVDKEGIPVEGASVSYACNSEAVAKECSHLKSALREEKLKSLHQSTGCPMHSAYALPQLRHYYDVYPAKEANKIYKWQTIASILLCRWTGRSHLPISFSEASWTGLLNIQTCDWDKTALQHLPKQCQEALPALKDCIDSDAVLGGIRQYTVTSKDKDGKKKQNPYWKRWPELRGLSSVDDYDDGRDDALMALSSGGCRLFLGVADGACANVGSKCTTASRIAVTIGTSAAVRVCIPAPINDRHNRMITVPPGLWCYLITKNQLLLGGALTDGGSVVQWAKNLLNLNDGSSFACCMKDVESLMEQEKKCSKQTSSAESFAPFLNGERSTGYRAGATGAMIGLTSSTTSASFLKSCLEGVTLRLNAIIARIISAAPDNERGEQLSPILVVSGTALEKNEAWRRMISDASQLQVIMDEDVQESTSRGAARLAAGAICIDLFGSSYREVMKDEPLEAVDTQNPNPNMRHKWDAKTQTQDTLIESVSGMW